jgi:hypothetical protein
MEGEKVYVCVWGATMTMVDFYRVLKETEKTIVLRKIHDVVVSSEACFAGRVEPVMDDYKYSDKFEDIRAYKKNGRIFSGRSGYKKFFEVWDGKPVYFNHCD